MNVILLFLLSVLCWYAVPVTTGKIPSRACLPPHNSYSFCNASQGFHTRVLDLMGRLSLLEKVSLLIARNSPSGSIQRLGIPEYDWGGNCLHGVQSRCIQDRCPTSFPLPNALGSTFNSTVWETMGFVIGRELRALWLHGGAENHPDIFPGVPYPHIGLDCWSPNVEIVRDPRWGRNGESPSEDPLVCGRFGTVLTRALQNNADPFNKNHYLQAIATLKHFVGNSLEGNWRASGNVTVDRHNFNAIVSMYDLHSTYLRPFREAIVNGGALGVMCSYNRVNGVPSCANHDLMNILRNEWQFDGYVVTDSGAIDDFLPNHHGFVENWTDAVSAAVQAGCDMESATWFNDEPWSTGGPYQEYIPKAVHKGLLDPALVDQAVYRVLLLRFRLGLFDPIEDQPFWHIPVDVIGSRHHHETAKEATLQSLVLLQNRNETLPFQAGKSVAIIGPHCTSRSAQLFEYLGQVCPGKRGSVACVKTVFEAVDEVNAAYGGETSHQKGCNVNRTGSDVDQAVALARAANYVIFVGGLDKTVEGEAHDRQDVSLPAPQVALLHKICSVNHAVTVVLFHGGIVTLDQTTLDLCPALVSAGYPGFFGAEALAETLFDTPDRLASNRWGRLAVTWYSREGWTDANFDVMNFTMGEGLGRTHRYYSGEPLFAFGHGLNYVPSHLIAFDSAVGALVETGLLGLDGRFINDSDRNVDEILFLYAHAQPGVIPKTEPAHRLKRELIDFCRVHVPAKATVNLNEIFVFGPQQLMLYDAQGRQRLYNGDYKMTLQWSGNVWDFNIHCSSELCILAQPIEEETTAQ